MGMSEDDERSLNASDILQAIRAGELTSGILVEDGRGLSIAIRAGDRQLGRVGCSKSQRPQATAENHVVDILTSSATELVLIETLSNEDAEVIADALNRCFIESHTSLQPSDHIFCVGETVWLKSGGPQMTIVAVDGQRVTCGWFTEERLYLTEEFPAESLSPDIPYD